MRYLGFFLLAIALVGCSVLLKDEKEIEEILEDIIHEELTQSS